MFRFRLSFRYKLGLHLGKICYDSLLEKNIWVQDSKYLFKCVSSTRGGRLCIFPCPMQNMYKLSTCVVLEYRGKGEEGSPHNDQEDLLWQKICQGEDDFWKKLWQNSLYIFSVYVWLSFADLLSKMCVVCFCSDIFNFCGYRENENI